MKALTAEQVASYRHDGFFFPIPALAPEQVAACLAGLGRLERELGSPLAEAGVALAAHQRATDQYRRNYDEQVRRHEREYAAAPA
jgi:hypothetical protein